MSVATAPAKARRRAANLSIDENVLAAAKELGVNASKAAEEGLKAAIRKAHPDAGGDAQQATAINVARDLIAARHGWK